MVSDFVEGTTVLDVDDPTGDDYGPGTYAYPTDGQFNDGAFDIERFQVIDSGERVFLRTTLRDLTPTFGSPLGAQLLDIFIRDPGSSAFSTEAPFASRNYLIAEDSAWSQRIEVEGFAAPQHVRADGSGLGPVTVTASDVSRAITIIVPKETLGQPGTGWIFSVVLHGQDGFQPDRARPFASTPQAFLFGVCAAGGTSPICAANPATVPKAVDVITPVGRRPDRRAGPDAATGADPGRAGALSHCRARHRAPFGGVASEVRYAADPRRVRHALGAPSPVGERTMTAHRLRSLHRLRDDRPLDPLGGRAFESGGLRLMVNTVIGASTGWWVGLVLGIVVIAVAAVIVIVIVNLARKIAGQARAAVEGVEVVRAQTDELGGIERINDSGVRILHSARALRKVAVGK